MKDMFKHLKEYYTEDPKDFLLSVLFVISLFFILWASLWIEAICSGKV